jgi:hypothetical protein
VISSIETTIPVLVNLSLLPAFVVNLGVEKHGFLSVSVAPLDSLVPHGAIVPRAIATRSNQKSTSPVLIQGPCPV